MAANYTEKELLQAIAEVQNGTVRHHKAAKSIPCRNLP